MGTALAKQAKCVKQSDSNLPELRSPLNEKTSNSVYHVYNAQGQCVYQIFSSGEVIKLSDSSEEECR